MDLFEALRGIRKNSVETVDDAILEVTISQLGSLMAAHDCKDNIFRLSNLQISNLQKKNRITAGSFQEYKNFYLEYSQESSNWMNFCENVSNHSFGDGILGYWLMSVTLNGLNEGATKELTHAMAKNGSIFDYSNAKNPQTSLIRRYPTGALSEKLALMMPTIISHFSGLLNIDVWSPFLIARVLGHTGGTRDKLSAIPGFNIADPGENTFRILQKCRAAYVATKSEFNPTDNRMYSLRSETDTIESSPLIVSSIASKMLSCPVDLMHIDVRWGQGAFFETYELANLAAKQLVTAIKTPRIDCFSTITEATHPTGSFLGAAGEVAEAVFCLGGGNIPDIDPRLVEIQRHLAADFSSRLLSEVSDFDILNLYNEIQKSFGNGTLESSFNKLFNSHGVRQTTLKELWKNPRSILPENEKSILSDIDGRLVRVDQHKLGRFTSLNFQKMNIQLHVKPGDKITKDSKLCTVFSGLDHNFDFGSCFEISPL